MSRRNGKQKARRQFTPEEKATILRRHLVDKVPVSDLCDAYAIQPTLFYLWQRQAFEHLGAKRLKGDLGGLVELVDDYDGETYRAVYTAKLAGVIYVLHVFQKKSTHGIATPRRHLQLIQQRLAWARAHATTLTEEAR